MAKDWNKDKYEEKPDFVEKIPTTRQLWIQTGLLWLCIGAIVTMFMGSLGWLVLINIGFIALAVLFYMRMRHNWKLAKKKTLILHLGSVAVGILFILIGDKVARGFVWLLGAVFGMK